jgi:hypothetical protein
MADAGDGTQVTWRREAGGVESRVTVVAPDAEMAAARRAVEAARSWGIAEAPERRIEIAFAGATPPPSTSPRTAWIASAAMSLEGNALAAAVDPSLAVGERDGVMTARTTVRASSSMAAALARAVLEAARPDVVDREMEPRAVDEATLAAWNNARSDPPVSPNVVPRDASDGRWLWALALALVLAEGAARVGRRERSLEEVRADAA